VTVLQPRVTRRTETSGGVRGDWGASGGD
jgi:hypothetical protein